MESSLFRIFAVLFLVLSPSLRAEILYGPEITFTRFSFKLSFDPNAVRTKRTEAALQSVRKALEAACAKSGCEIQKAPFRYGAAEDVKVVYPDGFWFLVSTDPRVLEVTARPSSLVDFRKNKERLERDLYAVMKAEGLTADHFTSYGHVNIGIDSAFGSDAGKFRNFVVDLVNHPELFTGVLGDSETRARPITSLSARQKKAFAAVIARFDDGQIQDISNLAKDLIEESYLDWKTEERAAAHDILEAARTGKIQSVKHLEDRITLGKFSKQQKKNLADSLARLRSEPTLVATPLILHDVIEDDLWYPAKKMAVQLNEIARRHRFPSERRLEIRGIRNQRSMDEFLLELELLERRMGFVGEKTDRVALEIPEQRMPESERNRRYQAWLEEMGAPVARYQGLRHWLPWWRRNVDDVWDSCKAAVRGLFTK